MFSEFGVTMANGADELPFRLHYGSIHGAGHMSVVSFEGDAYWIIQGEHGRFR
jgi:hypothetical protein